MVTFHKEFQVGEIKKSGDNSPKPITYGRNALEFIIWLFKR